MTDARGGKNVTLEKLAGLPFKTATDLKKAQEEVQLAIWRRLEEAKAIDTLTKRDEYKFWRDEFEAGLVCGYGEKDGNLVRVYSNGPGIKVNINEELAGSIPSSETLLGVLVKAMSESFASTYYKAKGILPIEQDDLQGEKKSPFEFAKHARK